MLSAQRVTSASDNSHSKVCSEGKTGTKRYLEKQPMNTSRRLNAQRGMWVETFFSIPVTHTPGMLFKYNSALPTMAGILIKKVTGRNLFVYLKENLLDELDIHIDASLLDFDDEGVEHGGFGYAFTARNLLKLGQLCLNEGTIITFFRLLRLLIYVALRNRLV